MTPVPRKEIVCGNKLCNDLSHLEGIDFYHTSHLDFGQIERDGTRILITHNSDTPITDDVVSHLPSCVEKWFCVNRASYDSRLECLPLGIENPFEAKKPGHGVGYQRSEERFDLLSSFSDRDPSNLLYANFRIHTNPSARIWCSSLCNDSPIIDYETPNLTLKEFYDKVLDYEAVICPDGNGMDTHRLWEILYLGRVPIVFNPIIYRHLYHDLPVILIEDSRHLFDEKIMRSLIDEAIFKKQEKLYFSFWKNLIVNGS